MTACVQAITAYMQAMTACVQAMTAGMQAMTAGMQAMTAGMQAMTAYVQAMTAYVQAMTACMGAVTAPTTAMTACAPLPLAVEEAHLLGVVAVARRGAGGHGAFDLGEVVGGQVEIEGSQRLGEPVAAAGSDERHDVLPTGEHPTDRDLRDRRVLLLGDRAESFDEG